MMIVLKIALILIGLLIIVYFYPKTKKKIEEMNALRTRTIEELKSIFKTTDARAYREMVEVKCRAAGENLLTAPYSNRQVVYYDCDIYRKEEEFDKEGHRSTTTRHIQRDYYRGNIAVTDNSTDETIMIDINNSQLNIPITYEKFEPQGGFNASIGGLNISLPNFNQSGVIGYEMKEKTIDVGQELYIIGEAYSDGNKIHIGKPTDGKKSFIVTTKSEEDMLRSLKTMSTFQMIAGVALIVIGAVLLFIK